MAHYLPVLLGLILGLALASAQGAEDDFVILTINGDLIGPIEPIGDRIDNAQQASRLISAYHQLLSAQVQMEVASLHEQILEFIPGFEVAYTASDSAEFSHLMSEIDLRLAAIQDVHAQKYTQDVIGLLSEAYQLILPTFGDEQ
ncbi:MAG: hypothetical protein COB20_05960 [SAR86 cluster bacterium]|uniref:Uncharacterized protein n=1 Tax=SAR86 cluster bacterium TaxID=2030880 RepID=A0A2A4X8Y0_9GAMM|nr:MAG: hypothetical protein COB20_05960 [SAR86 cluster bacterium]